MRLRSAKRKKRVVQILKRTKSPVANTGLLCYNIFMDEKIIQALKERYKDLHPLLFHRSKERAKTPGNLFDIVSKIPKKFPIVWNEDKKEWEHTKDLFQSKKFPKK